AGPSDLKARLDAGRASMSPSGRGPEVATVLVIEDEAQLRANLTRILSAENYRVVTAADGDQGIRRVLEDRPDLVICDILMPGTDGFGVLGAMRSRPETATIPFIFLTASADKEDLARGFQRGAT